MPYTLEEVQAEIGKNPELKNGLISSLQNDFISAPPPGVIVRTTQQDKEHLDNQINVLLPAKVEEKFSEKFKASLDEIDAEITALTGEKKGPHEKTTQFAKRALEALKGRGGDTATKARVTELEALLESKTNEYTQTLTKKEQEIFNKELGWQIDAELNRVNIAVPIHLKTDVEKQQYVNQQKALIKQGFLSGVTAKKDDQGNIIYYEADKPLMSPKDGKPKTAGEIISEKYAAWFTPGQHTVTGTGTGASGSAGANGTGGLSTKSQVHEHLKAQGLDPEVNDAAYQKQFEKLCSEHGIVI
jgi:hypothetical protein